jgi:cytochrome P450/NADPH-cytochrome P450 reductase
VSSTLVRLSHHAICSPTHLRTVFGAGNHDWVATYQRIPKLCDAVLEERGAHRLLPRGEGDAGGAEFFQAFDAYEGQLWETLVSQYGTTKSESLGLQMKLVDAGTGRASALRQPDVALGMVTENRLLTRAGPAKRHLEFELPEDMTYQAGDYLAM